MTPLSLLSSLIFAYRTFFSRLPVIQPHSSSKPSTSPPYYRTYPGRGGGGDSSSQRGLTSTFDNRSIASSNYTSNFPSAYHSRSTSFSTNANLPSYDPISTYRPQNSYPPAPPSHSQVTPSVPLSRKKSQTTISSVARKAVPVNVENGGAVFTIEGERDGEEEEAQSSSHHGSIWKEELK
jgi:hypothetical protein